MNHEASRVEQPWESSWRRDDVVARWGGILAGSFVVHACLILLGEIGAAVGVSAFEPGDRAAHYVWGAGAWGLASAAIAFFVGGGAASCVSRLRPGDSGLLQGALVWAVAVPIIGFLGSVLAIGAVTAGSVSAAAAVQVDAATPPPDAFTPEQRDEAVRTRRAATDTSVIREAATAAGAIGWVMVAGLVLSLGAAAIGGRLGAHRRPRHPEDLDDRSLSGAGPRVLP